MKHRPIEPPLESASLVDDLDDLEELSVLDTPFDPDALLELLPLIYDALVAGEPQALPTLGAALALGRALQGDPQDVPMPCQDEDPLAMTLRGLACATGQGTGISEELAAYWLLRAGRCGSPSALDILSRLVQRNPSLLGTCLTVEELETLWSQHVARPH